MFTLPSKTGKLAVATPLEPALLPWPLVRGVNVPIFGRPAACFGIGFVVTFNEVTRFWWLSQPKIGVKCAS